MRKHLFSRHKLILFMSMIFSSMLLANPMNSWEKIKTNQWLDSQLNVGLNIFSGWNSNQFFGTFDEGCTITTFPFNETFEADSASRICWTNEYVVGSSNCPNVPNVQALHKRQCATIVHLLLVGRRL